MIHEAAHALMHAPELIGPEARKGPAPGADGGRSRIGRLRARPVMLGLDTSAYCVGYIAGWAARGPRDQVAATAKAVLDRRPRAGRRPRRHVPPSRTTARTPATPPGGRVTGRGRVRRPPEQLRAPASGATCGVHRIELRFAPHREKSTDVFSLRFWLPASIHHPCPPPQPLAPLRYGRWLRTLFVARSLRSHENCRAVGLRRRPRALASLLTPETAKKRGRATRSGHQLSRREHHA